MKIIVFIYLLLFTFSLAEAGSYIITTTDIQDAVITQTVKDINISNMKLKLPQITVGSYIQSLNDTMFNQWIKQQRDTIIDPLKKWDSLTGIQKQTICTTLSLAVCPQ